MLDFFELKVYNKLVTDLRKKMNGGRSVIATTEQLVQEYIKDAIERAKNENQPKLVSLVKK